MAAMNGVSWTFLLSNRNRCSSFLKCCRIKHIFKIGVLICFLSIIGSLDAKAGSIGADYFSDSLVFTLEADAGWDQYELFADDIFNDPYTTVVVSDSFLWNT